MRGALCIASLLGAALLPVGTSAQQRAPDSRYEAIEIVQPQDDSTVFDNSGHVEVQIRVSPATALAPGHRMVLFLDGHASVPKAQALEHVERGMHRLQARILDSNGRSVIESKPITFYLWQASRNFPSRR
jgi:prepilin-type processing-associated H-X9-DG protein